MRKVLAYDGLVRAQGYTRWASAFGTIIHADLDTLQIVLAVTTGGNRNNTMGFIIYPADPGHGDLISLYQNPTDFLEDFIASLAAQQGLIDLIQADEKSIETLKLEFSLVAVLYFLLARFLARRSGLSKWVRPPFKPAAQAVDRHF